VTEIAPQFSHLKLKVTAIEAECGCAADKTSVIGEVFQSLFLFGQ
jgi:hypothetical protein